MRRLAWIPAAAAVVAMLAQGARWIASGQARGQWSAAARQGPASLLELDGPPPSPALAIELAGALTRSVFPPLREEAIALLEGEIRRDPLNSTLWFQLGRERLLVRDEKGARAALTRADGLDPRYPAQRFESIELWTILGDAARGLAVGREISKLGGDHRLRAIHHLLRAGHAPESIFDELSLAALPEAERLAAARALKVQDPAVMEVLLAKAGVVEIEDPAVKAGALDLALDPLVPGAAIPLWRTLDPAVRLKRGMPLANPDLAESPFLKEFPLGWRRAPAIPGLSAKYRRPSKQDLYADPFILVELRGAARERGIDWVFHRSILPAGTALKTSIKYRWAAAGEARGAVLHARRPGTAPVEARLAAPENSWSKAVLELPAAPAAAMVEFGLRTAPDSTRSGPHVELHLGPAEFEPEPAGGAP